MQPGQRSQCGQRGGVELGPPAVGLTAARGFAPAFQGQLVATQRHLGPQLRRRWTGRLRVPQLDVGRQGHAGQLGVLHAQVAVARQALQQIHRGQVGTVGRQSQVHIPLGRQAVRALAPSRTQLAGPPRHRVKTGQVPAGVQAPVCRACPQEHQLEFCTGRARCRLQLCDFKLVVTGLALHAQPHWACGGVDGAVKVQFPVDGWGG